MDLGGGGSVGILFLASVVAWLTVDSFANDLVEKELASAEAGDPVSILKLGRMYKTGMGASQDLKESEKWIERALGHNESLVDFTLGLMMIGENKTMLAWWIVSGF